MKSSGWILGAVVAGGVVFSMRSGCVSTSSAPDERLAGRFEAMCKIARSNISTPEKGVRKLGHYFARHTGDILGEFGETIVTIEKIRDDDKHDDRAMLARDRLQKPWRACERDWNRFWEAVENDEDAAELMMYFSERLNRTFEIILSGSSLDLEQLPRLLQQKIDPLSHR
jgi:hypothetical protein